MPAHRIFTFGQDGQWRFGFGGGNRRRRFRFNNNNDDGTGDDDAAADESAAAASEDEDEEEDQEGCTNTTRDMGRILGKGGCLSQLLAAPMTHEEYVEWLRSKSRSRIIMISHKMDNLFFSCHWSAHIQHLHTIALVTLGALLLGHATTADVLTGMALFLVCGLNTFMHRWASTAALAHMPPSRALHILHFWCHGVPATRANRGLLVCPQWLTVVASIAFFGFWSVVMSDVGGGDALGTTLGFHLMWCITDERRFHFFPTLRGPSSSSN